VSVLAETQSTTAALKLLPLDALHRARGAKFAPFAGYDMPVQYEGLIAEHKWTREHAGLFDVSHMGPCFLRLREGHGLEGDAAHAKVAAIVEPLVSADILGLAPGQQRLTVLLNEQGGVLDDLIIGRPAQPHEQGGLYIVVNGGVKEQDFAILKAAADKAGADFARADDRALLALQGPQARAVLKRLSPDAATLGFMTTGRATIEGARCFVACCGYTGEDGFEILAPMSAAPAIAEWLLAQPEVKPIGLGARDTLRLEAGLCLYGHELDQTISPIEAGLAWTIQKRRRKAADFPGAKRILGELKSGPTRTRVGIAIKEKAPARDGVEIFKDGRKIGIVTSGGFSPTLNVPISMGYVETQFAAPGTPIDLMVRGSARAAEIAPLPFVPHRYSKD
jgi:aminomethyltransferase